MTASSGGALIEWRRGKIVATVAEIFKNVVNDLFTVSTPWSFSSSRGGSLGAEMIGVSGGVLRLKNAKTHEEKELWYGAAGASVGPLPVVGTFSTPDMFSKCVGQIRARTSDPVTFEDMTGPICILSVSLVGRTGSVGEGGSASIYFLGIPAFCAITDVAVPLVLNWVATSAISARCVGMMYGRPLGAAAGLSIEIGYAH